MNSCYVHWHHSERIESYLCSGSCSHVELIIPLLSLLASLYFPPWKENKTRKQGHLYSGLIEWLTLQVWNESSLSLISIKPVTLQVYLPLLPHFVQSSPCLFCFRHIGFFLIPQNKQTNKKKCKLSRRTHQKDHLIW